MGGEVGDLGCVGCDAQQSVAGTPIENCVLALRLKSGRLAEPPGT